MGTDRYREKKLPDLTNPPSVQIRTNPYKSVLWQTSEAEKPDPEKARQDCGCSSDFCAEALREWTNRSMTEKIRKQRSEIARKTTRPLKCD